MGVQTYIIPLCKQIHSLSGNTEQCHPSSFTMSVHISLSRGFLTLVRTDPQCSQ